MEDDFKGATFLHTNLLTAGVLEDDFNGVDMVDNIIDPLTKNVAWSYFCLTCDLNLDHKEHIQDQAKTILKPNHVFLEPNSEDDRAYGLPSIHYSSVL